MLRQVNYGHRVLIAVRSSSVAPLDRESILAEPAAETWVMLLPSSSETAADRRPHGGFARASGEDLQAVVALLRSNGVTQVSTFVSFPVISAALPGDGGRLRAALEALAAHPNFDYAQPNEARVAQPR